MEILSCPQGYISKKLFEKLFVDGIQLTLIDNLLYFKNFIELTLTNGDVSVTQRNKDAGTLVVADFVDDAMQHGENFVATCM